jgi:hypothetical protein
LEPGEIRTFEGTLAPGRDRLVLTLDGDALTLDDRLPLLRPQPKRLRIGVDAAAREVPFVSRFLESLEAVDTVPLPAQADHDLVVVRDPARAPGAAVVLMPPAPGPRASAEAVAASPHALTEDLGFSALLVGDRAALQPLPSDELLLSAAGRPLVVYRPQGPKLIVGFDLERSNAARVPAFVLMLHRFVAQVRAARPGREQDNVETGQPLAVAAQGALQVEQPDGSTATVDAAALRAPDGPGFFRVRQGNVERFVGAAHFADAAEADLTRAASLSDPVSRSAAATSTGTRESAWMPLVVVLLAGLVAADGIWGARRR